MKQLADTAKVAHEAVENNNSTDTTSSDFELERESHKVRLGKSARKIRKKPALKKLASRRKRE